MPFRFPVRVYLFPGMAEEEKSGLVARLVVPSSTFGKSVVELDGPTTIV